MLEEEYNQKLESLRKYIPFLINMMTELKTKGNREAQLNKIQSLHDMITNSNKKLKLETLNRCEEVLNNIYFKVNPQLRLKELDSPQITPKINSPKPDVPEIESPSSTPASPSPPPILRTQPVTIPTEKIRNDLANSSPTYPLKMSHLPKVNVYSNVVINKPAKISKPLLPDMSKPPISLEDLKTLEEDVQQKLSDVMLENASVEELDEYRKRLELQIRVEQVNSAMTPQQSLELKSSSPKKNSPHKPTKDSKPNKLVKVLKEPDSTFGDMLSSIDEKLLEDKPKKPKKSDRKLSVTVNKEDEPSSSKTEWNCDKKNVRDIDTKANEKSSIVYKRLADKYHPKPRQKPVQISKTDDERDAAAVIEKNMKISQVQSLSLDNSKISLPSVLQNIFNKPLSDEITPRKRSEPSFPHMTSVGSTTSLPEPPMLSAPLLQLLSPNSILSPPAPRHSPVFNQSPRPSPIHSTGDVMFQPRIDMESEPRRIDFEPPNHLREPRFGVNQMYIHQTPSHYHTQTLDWGGVYYGNNNPIPEQKFYTECQWNEYYNHWGIRPGDPRTYKEYKEIKEREARAVYEKQKDVKDPRLGPREIKDIFMETKNPVLSKESISRDPRLSRFREKTKEIYPEIKSQSTFRETNYESKFDKMYSNTNKVKPTSKMDKTEDDEAFISPLDSLYMIGEQGKTGRGYGVQKFKIPKKSVVIKPKQRNNKNDESSGDEGEVTGTLDHGNDSEEEMIEKIAEENVSTTKTDEIINNETGVTSELLSHIDLSRVVVCLNKNEAKSSEVLSDSWISCSGDSNEFISEYDRENNEIRNLESPSLTPIILEENKDYAEVSGTGNSNKANTNNKIDSVKSEEPSEQNILAHFFENLLKSKNKTDKKSALFSLIETFSDSFDEKEIQKIRKIIKVQENTTDNSDDEKDVTKRSSEEIPEVGSTTEDIPEIPSNAEVTSIEKETNVDIGTEKINIPDSNKSEEIWSEDLQSEPVQESVGERIKNRRRNSVLAKPRKKLRTELDMLHEDIQEMFIRDGVLTANGKRMCRLLKDDPNALETSKKKMRAKPGPKPKSKITKDEIQKSMKDVRILINKMPDDVITANGRQLRSKTRKTSYVESEDDDRDFEDNESVRTDIEESGSEEDIGKSHTIDNTTRSTRRKTRRGLWALGIIPKSKNKKGNEKHSSKSEIIEPDKSYFYDYVERKKLPCKLCNYSGLLLTSHYLKEHPTSEVHCSRMSPEQATHAIDDFARNIDKYNNVVKKMSTKYSYSCRLCGFSTITLPVYFYEHVTTHTGEYRYQCNICSSFYCSTRKTLVAHFTSLHPGEKRTINKNTCSTAVIFAYLCGECNYFQLTEKHVLEHIHVFHLNNKPSVFKISMSEILDPALVVADENKEQDTKLDQSAALSEQSEEIPSTRIKLRKKPGPKSKTMPVSTNEEQINDGVEQYIQNNTESTKEIEEGECRKNENTESPKQCQTERKEGPILIKKKPGPKSKTQMFIFKQPENNRDATPVHRLKSLNVDESDDAQKTEEKIQEEGTESVLYGKNDDAIKEAPARKRRRSLDKLIPEDSEDDLDAIITLSSRSNRAAKEKATAKLRSLMENHDGVSGQKCSIIEQCKSPVMEQSNKKSEEEGQRKIENRTETQIKKLTTAVENNECVVLQKSTTEQLKSTVVEDSNKNTKEDEHSKTGDRTETQIKKPDLNVFTCKADIMEEDAKLIEEERLRKMDELTKSIGSRQSKLDFVDRLCNRLNNEIGGECVSDVREETRDIQIKKEVINESNVLAHETEVSVEVSVSAPVVKIATDSPKNPCKKPILDEETILPKSNIEFKQHKSVSLFSNIIEKLQGKVNEAAVQQEASQLVAKSPKSDDILTIGDIIKVAKIGADIIFSCLVDQCYVTTKDKIVFQLHCKFGHASLTTNSTLCEKCGVIIEVTKDTTLLENTFDHLMFAHSNFLEDTRSNKNRSLVRMRRLSGDTLSIKTENESAVNAATLEIAEDNPFPFKIVDVKSLAENTVPSTTVSLNPVKPVPPLTPIAFKQQPAHIQLVVKEAKLTVSELSRPRKAQKALTKFIETPGELYKCPHLYCMFGTNARTFFERHLKIHEVSSDSMVPCVYCDIKTPWEHVPIHIDIRHAHCQFACRYCLYRALLKEYVCIHQNQHHQGQDFVVIHLPQHRAAKKFSVVDLKFDHKSLCEPFRCGCEMNKEYLFENEFEKHLTTVHGDSILACGFPGCTHRVNAFVMLSHWSTFHGISTYQCGYCRTSGKEDSKMYMHFVKFHPSLQPHLLVRNLISLPGDREFGYSEEAFQHMRHIRKLPNLSTVFGKKCPNYVKLLKISSSLQSPTSTTTQSTPLMLTPVTAIPSGQGPPTKILLSNPNVKLLVTSSSEKLFLVPTSSISNPKYITSMAPINKVAVETVSTSETILRNLGNSTTLTSEKIIDVNVKGKISDVVPTENIIAEKMPQELSCVTSSGKDITDDETGPPPLVYIKEKTLPVTPVEHVVVPGTSTDISNILPEEVDPLILDNSVGETTDNFSIDINCLLDDPLTITTSPNTSEDPLNIDTSISLTKHIENNDIQKASTIKRSNSTFLASDEEIEGKLKHSGLSGLQLYKCAACNQSFSIPPALKHHLSTSTSCKNTGSKPYQCIHCGKLFKTPGILIDHLQTHGVQRFICSLCNEKFTTLAAVRSHNKSRHSIHHTTLVPLDNSRTDVETDIFVVKPTLLNVTPNKDTDGAWESYKGNPTEQIFMPDQIDNIPIRQIFNNNVKCGLCNYQTKVRVNIVRHLQMHSDEKSVPDTAPVNPVPCLEKNEKMFDKMINLAASSITGRMGVNKNEKEEDKYPEFVPTHCRFVCCAQGCSYLCPEEANLKHHLMALHSDDTNFTCAHCKLAISPTDADSVIKHFKLHGLHLYKCHYCHFVHHFKHKIEKHVVDTHLDVPVKVITVRYMESEPLEGRDTEESQAITPQKHKPWRCCMCKAKYSTRQDIQSHILLKHDVDAQYKCTLCTFKNDQADRFREHFAQNHSGHKIDIIFVYQKLDEETPKDDSFDTTPLWQRDKPRIRHIRGILFDEASPQPSKASKKIVKSPYKGPTHVNDAIKNLADCIDAVAKGIDSTENIVEAVIGQNLGEDGPQRVEPVKKIQNQNEVEEANDVNHVKGDETVIVIDSDGSDVEIEVSKTIKPAGKSLKRPRSSATTSFETSKMPKLECEELEDLAVKYNKEHLIALYGRFGSPHKKQWRCPKCHQFKSRRVADFIFHIFKDFNVYRYKCKICNDLSITYKYMLDHLKQHPGESENVIEALSPNIKLETWIHMVIREQTLIILKNAPVLQKLHSPEQEGIKCFFCDEKFLAMGDCCEHMLYHWKVMPYQCDHCSVEFYNAFELKRHCQIDHPDLPILLEPKGPTLQVAIKCCENLYKRPSDSTTSTIPTKKPKLEDGEVINIDLDDELAIDSKIDDKISCDNKVYACDMCAWTEESALLILQHLQETHALCYARYHIIDKKAPDKNMTCNVCEQSLPELQLRHHFLKLHPYYSFAPYRFKCPICDRKYLREDSLKIHLSRVHYIANPKSSYAVDGQLVYKCTLCNYSCIGKNNDSIKYHLKGHLLPVACIICEKRFKTVNFAEAHHNKVHCGLEPNFVTLLDVQKEFDSIVDVINKNVVPLHRHVDESMSDLPSEELDQEIPEKKLDLKKINTTFELNDLEYTTTADEMQKIFNLHTYVDVSDYTQETPK